MQNGVLWAATLILFGWQELRRPSVNELAVQEVHLLRLEVERTRVLVVDVHENQRTCDWKLRVQDLLFKTSVVVDLCLVGYIVYLRIKGFTTRSGLLELHNTFELGAGSDDDVGSIVLSPEVPTRPSDRRPRTWRR